MHFTVVIFPDLSSSYLLSIFSTYYDVKKHKK
jgi:hypothetical protein